MRIKNKIFFAAFVLTAFLSFLIVKPFISTILTAAVFVYVFHPVYTWFQRRVRNESLAAFIVVLLIIFLITIPLVFILNALISEVFNAYSTIKNAMAGGEFNDLFGSFYSRPEIKTFIGNSINTASNFIINQSSNFIFTLSQRLLYAFILVYLVYYLLKDSGKISKITEAFNFKVDKVHQPLISKLKETTHAVVYGTIIVAVAQGLLAGIGFYFLGAPSPILFGVITMIAALIPFLGATAVWLPISVYLFLMGYANSSGWGMAAGVILFLYGFLVISTIDNIIKPKIVGRRAHVHPVLVLIGVIGGINVFGFVGVIVGPVVLALLITFFDVYLKERLTWN